MPSANCPASDRRTVLRGGPAAKSNDILGVAMALVGRAADRMTAPAGPCRGLLVRKNRVDPTGGAITSNFPNHAVSLRGVEHTIGSWLK